MGAWQAEKAQMSLKLCSTRQRDGTAGYLIGLGKVFRNAAAQAEFFNFARNDGSHQQRQGTRVLPMLRAGQ